MDWQEAWIGMTRRKRLLLRALAVFAGVFFVAAAAFFVYFPGQQAPMALTLATGIGLPGLQAHIDALENKAIRGEPFTEDDRRFLRDLYTCFAKGGRLTIVLRQSAAMMDRYLSGSGEPLRTEPRIFVNSRKVREQMDHLSRQVRRDIRERGEAAEVYRSETFYMCDPAFFDSLVGLYFGHIEVKPRASKSGRIVLRWRAEVPWEWPSYESLYEKYGDHHAQCFPLPNAMSVLFGPRYCLRIDDGLGGHLMRIGLAKSFLVFSEWEEIVPAHELSGR